MYYTQLCGRAVCEISDSLNLIVSLAGGSIEIRDFGADVNNRAPLNYSVFTRQVQLGQGAISGGIAICFEIVILKNIKMQ